MLAALDLLVVDSSYLVALAMIEQEGKRALPLAGRTQKFTAPAGKCPKELAHALSLELLLRIWQRSDKGPLERAAGLDSLLLVELTIDRLQEDLPNLKVSWLNSGNSDLFKVGLQRISSRAWTIGVPEKYSGTSMSQLW